jgi:rare lipoprotein A
MRWAKTPLMRSLPALALALVLVQGCSLRTSPLRATNGDRMDTEVITPKPATDTGRIVPQKAPAKPASLSVSAGTASWYGPGFSGKRTASGEIFDAAKFTAAHQTLPFGSKARVTNLNNGKSVNVVINDRGPYSGNRIIDLSPAAARAIDLIERGVARVRIDLLGEESGAQIGTEAEPPGSP